MDIDEENFIGNLYRVEVAASPGSLGSTRVETFVPLESEEEDNAEPPAPVIEREPGDGDDEVDDVNARLMEAGADADESAFRVIRFPFSRPVAIGLPGGTVCTTMDDYRLLPHGDAMNDGNGRATTDSYTPLNEIDPAEERRMQVEKLLQRQREIPHIYVDEGRTDLANARRFSASFPHKARYCGTWDRWLVWADNRWIVSAGPEIEAIAKEKVKVHWANLGINGTDREGAKEAIRFAKYSSSAAGLRNMLHVARSEEGIPIAPNKLDADPWLLNCENGTLNLRTGELRKHRRDDLITKLCPTPFNPAAECPTLLATLNTIMGGNADLIGFIQRSLGMSLTGVIRDHVLLVCYGTGANGKSTLMNAFLDVIGDYGMKAPLGMLMAKRNESHPTDQADLAGRLRRVQRGGRGATTGGKSCEGTDGRGPDPSATTLPGLLGVRPIASPLVVGESQADDSGDRWRNLAADSADSVFRHDCRRRPR